MNSSDVSAGQCHNEMLLMASDTVNRWKTLPRLMVVMLRDGSWRRLVRPIDQRVFENQTVEQWVLGEPWQGLHFPDWATVYAMLRKNIEYGAECISLLAKEGAEDETRAEEQFRDKLDKANLRDRGRPKNVDNIHNYRPSGTSQDAALRRLRKDRPDLHARVLDGELSAHAAMLEAGFRKQKTPLEQLAHWWQKASADEQRAFLAWVDAHARAS